MVSSVSKFRNDRRHDVFLCHPKFNVGNLAIGYSWDDIGGGLIKQWHKPEIALNFYPEKLS